jgi:DNA topoisomerase VI subunit B
MAYHTDTENETVLREFREAVNMPAKELEHWLKTEESQSVGMKEHEGDESTGHQTGRHLVELLHKKRSDYSEDDYNQMRRVVSYIHRHSAQRPDGDIAHTRWRYSLKNWGHEPLKD